MSSLYRWTHQVIRGKRQVHMKLNAPTKRVIEAAVRRGAGQLDKQFPGWARKINVTHLDLKSGCNCVYGQLDDAYEDKTRGPGRKGTPGTLILQSHETPLPKNLNEKGYNRETAFGYIVPDEAYNAAGLTISDDRRDDLWAYQENCWRDEIRKRARYDLAPGQLAQQVRAAA